MKNLDKLQNYIKDQVNKIENHKQSDLKDGILLTFANMSRKIEEIKNKSTISDCANFEAICKIREILKAYHNGAEILPLTEIEKICDARYEAEIKEATNASKRRDQ